MKTNNDVSSNEIVSEIEHYLQQILPDNIVRTHFIKSLSRIVRGDNDRDRKVYVFRGSGNNGKTTFINLILNTMGAIDSCLVPYNLLYDDSMFSDVSPIFAKNLVVSEAELGYCSHKMKLLTGKDPITYRELYHQKVTFTPHFDIIICTNRDFVDNTGRCEFITFSNVFVDHPDPSHPNEIQKSHIEPKFEVWAPVFKHMLMSP